MDASETTKQVELREETQPPADAADPLIGKTIDDRYEVIKLLGAGGMGKVYQVKHLQLNRLLALKLLNREDFDKHHVDRFHEEAKTASGLHHPNLVSITDHASYNGAPYLVMEFAEGENLDQMISHGPIPQAVALEIFMQICSALEYAHGKSVIHRDIKPSNIIVLRQPNGKVQARLVDFGIAKSLEPDSANLTQTGMVLGTPGFMSPEQATGNRLSPRSDIYALGCVMFEALTGKPLFEGTNNMQIIFKHINERPPLFKTVAPADTNIKPELERVVMQCLEKEPENRYQNCEDLGKDLALIASGKNPVKEAAQGRKRLRKVIGAAKLIAFGVAFFFLWRYVGATAKQAHEAMRPAFERSAQVGFFELEQDQPNFAAAEILLKKGLEGAKKANDVMDATDISLGLAKSYEKQKRYTDAEQILQEAIARDANEQESGRTEMLHAKYADILLKEDKFADAEKEATSLYQLRKRATHGKETFLTDTALRRVFVAQASQGKFDAAMQTADTALAESHHIERADEDATSRIASWYVHEFGKFGRNDQAAALRAKAGITEADVHKWFPESL